MWLYGGLLTDEWKSSDTFSQRNETDQRSCRRTTPTSRARTRPSSSRAGSSGRRSTCSTSTRPIRRATSARCTWPPASRSSRSPRISATACRRRTRRMACTSTARSSRRTRSTSARRFYFDSALARSNGSDALSVAQKQALLVMRARVLVDQGQFANAAALVPVTAVPTNFQYLLDVRPGDGRQPDLEPQHQRGPLHGRRQL